MDHDDEDVHARWENDDGNTVSIEKFEDGTWDALEEGTLLENFDTPEEAFERLRQFVEE